MFKDYSSLLKKLLLSKFTKGISHITSFEIDMESNTEDSKFQKLVDKVELAANDELFLELKKYSIPVNEQSSLFSMSKYSTFFLF